MKRKERLVVKKSSAGLGLYAGEDIEKEDEIIEYTGERISSEEADRRGGRYLFDVTDTLVIDGKGRKNLARYINHSCSPNAYAEIDTDTDRVFIYAKRNIKEGEEITYHYGKTYWEDIIGGAKKCRCNKCTKKNPPR